MAAVSFSLLGGLILLIGQPIPCLAELPAPGNLRAVQARSGGDFTVSWTYSLTNIEGFRVYKGGKGTPDPIPPSPNSAVHSIVISTSVGESAVLSVSALNGSEESARSETIEVTALPYSPINVEVSSPSYGVALVQWTHAGGDETDGFFIRQVSSLGELTDSVVVPFNTSDPLKRQERNVSVDVGQVYNISVINQYRGWKSPDLSPVTFISRPATPVSVRISGQTIDRLELTWIHGGGPVTSYVVRYRLEDEASLERTHYPINTSDTESAEFTVNRGYQYTFWVMSVENDIRSTESDAVTTVIRPDVPVIQTVTNVTIGQVKITWSHSNGKFDAFRIDLIDAKDETTTTNVIVQSTGNQPYNGEKVVNVTPGQEYTVYMFAVSHGEPSARSEPVTFTSEPVEVTQVTVTQSKQTTDVPKPTDDTRKPSGEVTQSTDSKQTTALPKPTQETSNSSERVTQSIHPTLTTEAGIPTTDTSKSSESVSHSIDPTLTTVPAIPTKDTSTPSAPSSVKVTSTRYDTLSVTWDIEDDHLDNVTVTLNSSLGQEIKRYTSESWIGTHTVDFTVTPGHTYTVWAVSTRNNLDSPKSEAATILARPATPVSVQVSSLSHGMVSLSWGHGGGEIDQYLVKAQNGQDRAELNVSAEDTRTLNMSVTPGEACSVSVMSTYLGVQSLKADYSFQAPVECYTCTGNPDTCGRTRNPADTKQLCDFGETCWIRHQLDAGLVTFIRRCESTVCSTAYQTRKCDKDGTENTCSRCCIGDACNMGFVKAGSSVPVLKPSLFAGCIFVTISVLLLGR